MGSEVFVSEVSREKRERLDKEFKLAELKINLIGPEDKAQYEALLASSEVIVASVHAPGKRAPIVIDLPLLQKISAPKRKIILDIAIDQGGNVAESRPVDYENPLYIDSLGNLRFSVTNIPSLCGRGASLALEAVSLGYTAALAGGLEQALKQYPELESGINILNGAVIHPALCDG